MKFRFVAGLLLVGFTGFAQKAPKVKGEYVINKSKIDFGKAPETILPSAYTIVPAKNHLAITRKMDSPAAEIIEDMNFDGSPAYRDRATGKASAAITLINDTSFKVNKFWFDKDGKTTMKSEETWDVEDKGKSLKVNYVVEQQDGLKYTLVGYYDKK